MKVVMVEKDVLYIYTNVKLVHMSKIKVMMFVSNKNKLISRNKCFTILL